MARIASLGMVGRIVLVLVVAVLLELLGNIALHRWQDPELLSAEQTRRVAARLVTAERTALAAAPRDREGAMHGLAGDGMTLNWVPRTVLTDFAASLPRLAATRAEMLGAQPALATRELRLTLLPSAVPGERDLVGARQLADESFVTFRVGRYLGAPPRPGTVVLMHVLLTTLVLGMAVLTVHALVRPLRRLAEAADATGQAYAGPIEVAGPPEVQRVATAFSAMRERLIRTMEDHTQSLVAVSHDLRTPIQRLQLRASLTDDGETREAMAADLDEMEHFIDSTLTYFRSGEDEAARLVDIAAIAMTAVDTAADLGVNILYRGPDALQAMARPLAAKRILANLIDNARHHAHRIEVSLHDLAPDCFRIDVEDDGPGIPPERRAEAMLPFRRLETADGQKRGGAGLGLASAGRASGAMGGRLDLGESALGGLRASLTLPRG